MRVEERKQAIELRKKGKSIRTIAKILNITKGSISRWVHDVQLTDIQKIELMSRLNSNSEFASKTMKEKWFLIRKKYQENGRLKTKEGNLLHIAGCMLFWAEGSKKRNAVIITNSDPFLLKFFIKFLKTCYDIKNEDFFMSINAYTDINPIEIIEKYWLNILSLPRTCLKKSTINNYSKYSMQKKSGKLPYGTCRIGVHRTDIAQNIYGAIQEYAEFNKPEWM